MYLQENMTECNELTVVNLLSDDLRFKTISVYWIAENGNAYEDLTVDFGWHEVARESLVKFVFNYVANLASDYEHITFTIILNDGNF